MPADRQKYIFWDFDGTLAWRPGGWTGALLSVLRSAHPAAKLTSEQIRPYLQSGFPWHAPENPHPGLTPAEWWEELTPVFTRAFRAAGVQNGQALDLSREVRTVYLDPVSWHCYHDTIPTLERLSSLGWHHILLSNHIPELPILLERLGLWNYFEEVFNSAQTGYEKPNPRAFRNVLDWIGTDAVVWVIGDSYRNDVLGALEAGLPGILVRKPHPEASVFCQSLAQIPEKL